MPKWYLTPEEDTRIQAIFEGKLIPCNLYRVLWFNALGYVVYRHCFDSGDDEIRTRQGAIVHKTAVFVTEGEAKHYAQIRNELTERNGTDAIARL